MSTFNSILFIVEIVEIVEILFIGVYSLSHGNIQQVGKNS